MKLEDGLTTTAQSEILSTHSGSLWNYLVLDGENIANIIFKSSPELKETSEGAEALKKAITDILQ